MRNPIRVQEVTELTVKDMTRWQLNEDGSYSRRIPTQGGTVVEEGINATAGALAAAEELGVDISTVTGTGADGRILKSDVEAAAE